MQTFLPYADFAASAKALDYRRLGKQRVEARQISNTLLHGGAWSKHPAVEMWRGYEALLLIYGNEMILEWIARGYVNNMPLVDVDPRSLRRPSWYGDDRLHSSHRANLLRKNPAFYSRYGWTEDPTTPYWWPILR